MQIFSMKLQVKIKIKNKSKANKKWLKAHATMASHPCLIDIETGELCHAAYGGTVFFYQGAFTFWTDSVRIVEELAKVGIDSNCTDGHQYSCRLKAEQVKPVLDICGPFPYDLQMYTANQKSRVGDYLLDRSFRFIYQGMREELNQILRHINGEPANAPIFYLGDVVK
jgi:hypothetical protein